MTEMAINCILALRLNYNVRKLSDLYQFLKTCSFEPTARNFNCIKSVSYYSKTKNFNRNNILVRPSVVFRALKYSKYYT